MEEQTQEPQVAVVARQRQVNKLIALGLAFCILLIFGTAVGYAIFAHSLSGQPLVH
ncbi:MAG TPA: hypothetical protein VKA19_04745 [Alphaproteobacteria bacterium]|nr:hypothetical protein [Alphaproteobacteria bacterium]